MLFEGKKYLGGSRAACQLSPHILNMEKNVQWVGLSDVTVNAKCKK